MPIPSGRAAHQSCRSARARSAHALAAILALVCWVAIAPRATAEPPRTVALNTWEPFGPTLTTIFTITRDPLENGTLFAGTNFGGMYRSDDGGLNWSIVLSPFTDDAVFGIAIAPTTPRHILVATQNGGLYRSLDDGATWANTSTGLPPGTVRTVAFDPFTPQRALVSTDQGVFRSTDNGATWAQTITTIPDFLVEHLLYNPFTPNIVYAGTLDAGVFRSLDAGVHWFPFTDGIGNEDIVALSADANITGRIWAATPAGVFSHDPGDPEWIDWTLDLPADALIKHVATVANRDEILVSTDQGVYSLVPDPNCLTNPPDPPPPGSDPPEQPQPCSWFEWYDIKARAVIADNTGALIHVVHTINYFEATDDFGQHWFPSARGMQNLFCGALTTVDVDGVTGVYAGTGNDIRATSDGFVEQGEQQWGLQFDVGGAIFDLASDPIVPARILAGTEGFGVLRSTNYGNDWTNASTGMVPKEIVDIEQSRAPAGTLYAGTAAGMYVSSDDGRSWHQRAQDQNPVPIVDVEADPVFPGWVYYATADGVFYRSQNDGESFFPLWAAPPGDSIRQIDRAPFFELYAVLASGGLLASTDDGLNFFPRGENDITHRVLCVATTDNRPWIAYVGTEFGGVYHTGSNGTVWDRRAEGMGDDTISSLAVATDDDRIVAAGAKGAVYISSDEGLTWTRNRIGLPPTGIVSSVSFDPNTPMRMYARIVIPKTEQKAAPATTVARSRSPRAPAFPFSPFHEDIDAKSLPSATAEGVYTSYDRGTTWFPFTNNPDYSRATALCPSRTEPGVFIAGAKRVGIARTTDNAASWIPSSDGLTLIVLSIAADPSDPNILYAATFSSGVFRSIDGGDTWKDVGPDNVIVFHVAVDPIVHTTIYASTSVGVMRSDDSASTWRLAGQDTAYIIALAADPTTPGRAYAGSYDGQIYRTDDSGATWLDISAGIPVNDVNDIAVSPIDGTVYALTAASGLYRSHDAGLTWWPANNEIFGGLRALKIAIDPTNNDLYIGLWGGGLRSSDGGDTWTALPLDFGQDYPSAIDIAALANGQSVVFISVLNEVGEGIDPGKPILRSADHGATWTQVFQGIPSLDATAIAVAPGAAPRVYVAATDGVFYSDNLGDAWQYASFGLAPGTVVYELAVDPANPFHVTATTSAGLYETANSGGAWNPVAFDTIPLGALPLRVAYGPVGRLFVGTTERGVFASPDGGVSWHGGVTPETSVMVPQALAVNPTDRSTLWVATGDQGVAVSHDRGETWKLANNGLSAVVMFTITIDPVDPDTIYATSQDAGIWVSVDAGDTWAPLNTGLTNKFVTAFAIDVNNHKVLYAGTEGGGVFRLTRP